MDDYRAIERVALDYAAAVDDRDFAASGRWLFARRDLEPVWRSGDESQLTLDR